METSSTSHFEQMIRASRCQSSDVPKPVNLTIREAKRQVQNSQIQAVVHRPLDGGLFTSLSDSPFKKVCEYLRELEDLPRSIQCLSRFQRTCRFIAWRVDSIKEDLLSDLLAMSSSYNPTLSWKEVETLAYGCRELRCLNLESLADTSLELINGLARVVNYCPLLSKVHFPYSSDEMLGLVPMALDNPRLAQLNSLRFTDLELKAEIGHSVIHLLQYFQPERISKLYCRLNALANSFTPPVNGANKKEFMLTACVDPHFLGVTACDQLSPFITNATLPIMLMSPYFGHMTKLNLTASEVNGRGIEALTKWGQLTQLVGLSLPIDCKQSEAALFFHGRALPVLEELGIGSLSASLEIMKDIRIACPVLRELYIFRMSSGPFNAIQADALGYIARDFGGLNALLIDGQLSQRASPALTDLRHMRLLSLKLLSGCLTEDVLRSWYLGNVVFSTVRELGLSGNKLLVDHWMRKIGTCFPFVSLLRLQATAITDAGLASLFRCKNLLLINVKDTLVTTQGLLMLSALTKRKQLYTVNVEGEKIMLAKVSSDKSSQENGVCNE